MREPINLRIATSVAVDGCALESAATVYLPDVSPRAVLVCLAGGNMNRRYYDLRGADGDDSFSFAAQMCARDFAVVAIDHPGLGDSTRPADGYALTPERIVEANTQATDALLRRLRGGCLVDGVPAWPELASLGVGHSMGAMLTVLQQAQSRSHRGVALLGFSTRGLPEYLPPAVREQAKDPACVREHLVTWARAMFVQPYPVIRSSGNGEAVYGSAKADPRGVSALKAATDVLLPVPAFRSMIPGNVAAEAAQIEVPVFLGLGTRDMAGPPHEVPAAFRACTDLSLRILEDTGHSHFLFASRGVLFDALADWAVRVLRVPATPN